MKVPYNSDLKRKSWMREGLLQSAHKSFWNPLTGNSMDSVVYQAKNGNAGAGHTVVFDFNGNLSGKAIKGRNTAFGKGEQKRKFSNLITVERYRLVVDNGDEFDGVDIGDLSITQHSDSRKKLGDLFQRSKDQILFDSAQGLAGQNPSHTIDLNTTFGYNELLDIEKTLRTSNGFSTGGIRRPLEAYRTQDGRPCWLFVMDAAMATMLRKNDNYQSLVFNADVRGDGNRAIKGIFGKIGQLMLVEAEQFFGDTDGTGTTGLEKSGVEISGLRQKDGNGIWTGQEGFSYAADLHSRGLLLGAGALQIAFGKQPDYKHQKSQDFSITSESACEFWINTQKTVLKAETNDYNQAKLADIDYGVVAVDVKVA
jgi:hypothetical protein